jgi:succinyl-CoA synthetase beta subunit
MLANAEASGRRILSEFESKQFVRVLGISVPRGEVAKEPQHAAGIWEKLRCPTVVKVIASGISHKSDIGAVVFPVESAAAAIAACSSIAERVQRLRPDAEIEGFLIEEYRPSQVEWILALRVDAQFGPAIMFGLGGIYVDVWQQVSFRLAPLRERDIDALITERPVMRILDGMRGRAPANREALKSAIRNLSSLAAMPELINCISEIEINPLTIEAGGVCALDALIVLRSAGVH